MPAKRERKPLVTSDAQDELMAHTYTLEQLIEGARKRSRAHVGELSRRYGERVYRHVEFKNTGLTVEGVLSEVFMRLPDALPSYENREQFEAFLFKIADRIVIDGQRRNARHRRNQKVRAPEIGLKPTRSPRKAVEKAEMIELLASTLSPRAREVWTRSLAGFSYQDIGEELGMTPTNVGVMLNRAWKVIRARAAELELRPADIADSGVSSGVFSERAGEGPM